jgi:type I restriction enzyme S subunit
MRIWHSRRLDEITEPIKDIYNPDGSNHYTYIGLEHIEQETLRISAVGDSSDVTSIKFKFKHNDVLFGKLRPYFRKVVQPKFSGICSTDIWVFRAKEGINQKFLFYFLANSDFVNTANHGESGTRMPRADWKFLQSTEWVIPPLPEQTAIAEVLSSLDDKIDLLHRQNKTLEQLAETLFRQWFVEEAEEGWEVGKVLDLFKLQRGFDLPTQSRIDGPYPVITSSGPNAYHNEYKVKGPGVTTGRSGIIGNVYYIEEDFWPLNTSLFVVEYNLATPLFSYFYLKNLDLESLNAGSAVPTLNRNDVHLLETKLPPKSLIQEFDNQAKPIFQKLKSNTLQIRTLTQLRDTLLPKLMSREVRVEAI